jgi:hypothetical protein
LGLGAALRGKLDAESRRKLKMKLAGDPNNPAWFKDDATAEELREEVMRHIARLLDAGVIDLEALPAPRGGKAQPIPSVDQSVLNGE